MTILRSPLLFPCILLTTSLAACSVTDDTVEARRGEKVEVCHIAGQSGNAETISVSVNAVDAHLDHGDYLGPCLTPCEATCQDLSSTVGEICLGAPLPPEELEAFCGLATQIINDNCAAACPEPEPEACDEFCWAIADQTREDCYAQEPSDPFLCDIGADITYQECTLAFECPPPPPTCWDECWFAYEEGMLACEEAGGDPGCFDQVWQDQLLCESGCCQSDCVEYECSYCEGDEQCLAECGAQCEQWCGPSCFDECWFEYNDAITACQETGGDPQCFADAEAQWQACEGSCCGSDCVQWQCDYCEGDEQCLAECSALCDASCEPWSGDDCYEAHNAAWNACFEAGADDPCYYDANDALRDCELSFCESDCLDVWCPLNCQGDDACIANCPAECAQQCQPWPQDCYTSCYDAHYIAIFQCDMSGADFTCYEEADQALFACEAGCCEADCNASCEMNCGGDAACIEQCQAECPAQCGPHVPPPFPGEECFDVCAPDDTACFQDCCSQGCMPEDIACQEECCFFGCDVTGGEPGCFDACFM